VLCREVRCPLRICEGSYESGRAGIQLTAVPRWQCQGFVDTEPDNFLHGELLLAGECPESLFLLSLDLDLDPHSTTVNVLSRDVNNPPRPSPG
jgi:hypothetical protein